MTVPDGLLEVGRVVKAHGLAGEIVVHPVTNVAKRFDAGAELVIDGASIQVEASRRHGKRWLLKLRGVDDRNAAESLRQVSLYAEPLEGETSELFVHELIGAEVATTGGVVVGTVEAVQENPAHDLLVLSDGTLVPIVFVVEHRDDRLVIEPPPGLLEL